MSSDPSAGHAVGAAMRWGGQVPQGAGLWAGAQASRRRSSLAVAGSPAATRRACSASRTLISAGRGNLGAPGARTQVGRGWGGGARDAAGSWCAPATSAAGEHLTAKAAPLGIEARGQLGGAAIDGVHLGGRGQHLRGGLRQRGGGSPPGSDPARTHCSGAPAHLWLGQRLQLRHGVCALRHHVLPPRLPHLHLSAGQPCVAAGLAAGAAGSGAPGPCVQARSRASEMRLSTVLKPGLPAPSSGGKYVPPKKGSSVGVKKHVIGQPPPPANSYCNEQKHCGRVSNTKTPTLRGLHICHVDFVNCVHRRVGLALGSCLPQSRHARCNGAHRRGAPPGPP